MGDTESLLRNISDTALWAAMYRARETDRDDALFRDPFARRLAGERGEQITDSMPLAEETTWAWIMRTYLFDRLILAGNRTRRGCGCELGGRSRCAAVSNGVAAGIEMD